MTIQEIERGKNTSRIVVTRRSGASVPTAMALTEAFYSIARARKKRFFIQLKEWDDKKGRWNYLIGFADKKEPNPLSFFKVKGSDKKGDQLEYDDVKAFDWLF